MDPLLRLTRELHERAVRFVLIGVAGANYYAMAGSDSFLTQDRDLFLPLDPDNLVACWAACEAVEEPLDSPRDRWRLFLATHRDALEQLLKREG